MAGAAASEEGMGRQSGCDKGVAAHWDSRKHGSCLTLHEVKNTIVDRQAERAYAKVDSMPPEALDAPRTAVIAILREGNA
jgi:hypothetical protein